MVAILKTAFHLNAMLPFVLTARLPFLQELLECNGKVSTYHNYTSSDMQPQAYHQLMVPVGRSKTFSMIVSFESVAENLQDSQY